MNLQEKYNKEIIPAMKEKFGYVNIHQVPKITKVSINVGVGRHSKEKAFIDGVANNLSRIAGQKPVLAKAKKSIASFKIRQGMIVGVFVNLRGKRMYDFLNKLVNVSFPRVRDFRGINKDQVDNRGNITIGIKEHLAFPEIKADEVDNVHGVEISISTTAENKEEGLELLTLIGLPFKK